MNYITASQLDKAEIARTIELLFDPTANVMIQALPARRFFHLAGSEPGMILTAIDKLHELNPAGIYGTLNPVREGVRECVKNEHILKRYRLLVDIDRDKSEQPDQSASEEEKQQVRRLAGQVIAFLTSHGLPAPTVVDSGNGMHLLWPIDMPNDEASETLIKNFLQTLNRIFGEQIDKCVYDARRIIRVPGTWNAKGNNTPERPHRLARFLQIPEVLGIATVEMLRRVIDSVEQKPESQAVPQTAPEHGVLSNPGRRSKPSSRSKPTKSVNWPPIEADDLPADILLPRLRGVTNNSESQWSARCPAHADSKPSLSITETDDYKLLVYCHARGACTAEKIMSAVGLRVGNLYPSDYAVFKARKSGKRKALTLNQVRPGTSADPAQVADALVEELTAHATACYECAKENNYLSVLAEQLRLPVQALAEFGVGLEFFNVRHKWIFVERDGKGRIVGLIRRDYVDGGKMSFPGSRRGLIFASPPAAAISNPASPIYIPEGHTDTIALHAAGCLAIGRPAALLSGAANTWLVEFFVLNPNLQSHPIVVVGDNDSAGKQGAMETASKLNHAIGKTVAFDFPPLAHKDMRDWITAGTFTPGWPFTMQTTKE